MRNNKGFTLIEMAVVLVIIGIILGAVIKGNDLIENAKVKGVIQAPTKWEVPIMTYYDKKGSFPGSTSGQITSFTALKTALGNESIAYPADTISDVTFDIASVTDPCKAGATVARNIMLITNVPDTTASQLDLAIDGISDGTKGRVRSCGAAGTANVGAAWTATGALVPVVYFFDKTIP
ncbi:prepilin-type N-terminal cleavage/methylation domain-containing protein [Trichlorobacter lovleyi]|uniref:type II secretion system protein n=1 Tax=Trichlorobacter lovleyi TaxID=313985 RepID=UPI00223EF54C|nr:prepilin-type N-terminal cleavage/methylation domain-containing protein [Trichlorobacter lovleyi]QOX79925.1 prepilin-type N-terminal cleavage/methylation domain-containing protein [Trichlorobacter lovleyi]